VIYDIYKQLEVIAGREFGDILIKSEIIFTYSGTARKLRLYLIDGTFVDIWYSVEGEYSFHWEQRGVRETVYRHDNAPHRKWIDIKTFPRHCHDGSEQNVSESNLPDNPGEAVKEFLVIVRKRLFEYRSFKK